MAMSQDDRSWLQGEFNRVHDRINGCYKETGRIREMFAEEKAKPCSDVLRHVDKHHDGRKNLGLLATLITIAGGVGAGVVKFIDWVTKSKSQP
jgi:hypothetical protein